MPQDLLLLVPQSHGFERLCTTIREHGLRAENHGDHLSVEAGDECWIRLDDSEETLQFYEASELVRVRSAIGEPRAYCLWCGTLDDFGRVAMACSHDDDAVFVDCDRGGGIMSMSEFKDGGFDNWRRWLQAG